MNFTANLFRKLFTVYLKVLKYISVGWLCIKHCIDQELKKYHALKSYFLSEHVYDHQFKCLKFSLKNPMTEIYLMFFSIIYGCINQFEQVLAEGRASHLFAEYIDG